MSHPGGERPNLLALTSLRGIAAVSVMFHNISIVWLSDVARVIPSKIVVKSYLFVDMFFLLSGFVLAHVYARTFAKGVGRSSYGGFMLARTARIYPLHLAILAVLVAFECGLLAAHLLGGPDLALRRAPFTGTFSLFNLFLNLLQLQVFTGHSWNDPAWSISAEWLTYLAVPSILFFIGRSASRSRLAIVGLALAALVWMEIRFGDLGLFYAGWPMLVRCLAECLIGVTLFHWSATASVSGARRIRLMTPLGVLTVLTLMLPIPHVLTVLCFMALIYCAAPVTEETQHWLADRRLVLLGTLSYAIYMLHWPVMQIASDLSYPFTGETLRNLLTLPEQVAALAAAMSLVVLTAYFTYSRIERPWRSRVRQSRTLRRALGIDA